MSNATGNRDRVRNYYGVGFGKIVKSLTKDQAETLEGAESRVNTNGKTVYELKSDYIQGHLTKVELEQPHPDRPEFGEQLKITLEHEGEKNLLQIKFDSSYGRGFMQVLPNLDLSAPIEIEPYDYVSKKDGKQKVGLDMIQFGASVNWCYTQELDHDMPPLVETNIAKHPWDNTEQLAWFRRKLAEFSKKVDAAAVREIAQEKPVTQEEPTTQEEPAQENAEGAKKTDMVDKAVAEEYAAEEKERAAAKKEAETRAADELPKKPQAKAKPPVSADAMADF